MLGHGQCLDLLGFVGPEPYPQSLYVVSLFWEVEEYSHVMPVDLRHDPLKLTGIELAHKSMQCQK